MQKKTRLYEVDMAKGFAMLLVLIGHCTYSDRELVGWLYSFHMPLFFALSGFTFHPEKYKSLREVIDAKFRQLIIPYFLFNTILWVLSLLLLDGLHLQYRHLNELIGIVVADRLSDYFFSLWFLTALFLAEPLLWCLTRMTGRRTGLLMPLSVCSFAAGAVILPVFKGTYWSADLVPIALSFLLLGYLASIWFQRSPALLRSRKTLALAWGVNLLFFWLNFIQVGRSDLYFCKLGNPVYFYLSACGGTIGALSLCLNLGRLPGIEYIGRNSLVFYAFESLAIPLSERLLRSMWGASSLESAPFVSMLMVLSLSCGMLAFASFGYAAFRRRMQTAAVLHVY
ncbi:MAG: acyltransferase family protein [Clostridia bacterium]|nr:acyltransferase family protein [Clostridia bacterium]